MRSRKQFIYLMFPAFYCRLKQIYDCEGADKTKPDSRKCLVCVFFILQVKKDLFCGTGIDKGEQLTKHFDCAFCRSAVQSQIWKSFAPGLEVYVSCPLNLQLASPHTRTHSHSHSQSQTHSHNAQSSLLKILMSHTHTRRGQ